MIIDLVVVVIIGTKSLGISLSVLSTVIGITGLVILIICLLTLFFLLFEMVLYEMALLVTFSCFNQRAFKIILEAILVLKSNSLSL
jgi:hypothetical protein